MLTRIERMTDERGVAMPMAMLTLLMLTTLMMAFSVLAQSEPVIAANQQRIAQARALAESGFEHAIWALTNDTDPNGIPNPMILQGGPASTPAAPWDGQTFVGSGSLGGFTVAVRNDQSTADPNIREITATGWTPTNVVGDGRIKGHRTVFARVKKIPLLAINAPCALCVKGALNVSGTSVITGTNFDGRCGGNDKYGTYTQGATTATGNYTVTGGAGGMAQNQPADDFKPISYTSETLDSLKELAKKNGTYFGPGYPNGGFTNDGSPEWTGNLSFSAANRVANGIIFVDTMNGENVEDGTSANTLGTLNISGNPFTGEPNPGSTLPNVPTSTTPGAFTGMIIVNGSLSISGGMRIDGLVYAVNDFTYNGTGNGGIFGLAISQNYRDISATSIDTSATGNSNITFDCEKAMGFNMIPPSFNVIAGTYRELPD